MVGNGVVVKQANYISIIFPGSTIINHDKMQDQHMIPFYSQPNGFNLALHYDVELDKLKGLIDVSKSCFQEVTFNCHASKITSFAAWTDGKWNSQPFFHNGTNQCECMKSNTCFGVTGDSNTCHCDMGDPVSRQDVIRIENKVCPFKKISLWQDASTESTKGFGSRWTTDLSRIETKTNRKLVRRAQTFGSTFRIL